MASTVSCSFTKAAAVITNKQSFESSDQNSRITPFSLVSPGTQCSTRSPPERPHLSTILSPPIGFEKYSHLGSLLSLLDVAADNNVLDSLIGELEILLKGNMVLNLHPDDRGSDDQGAAEEAPGAAEHGVELGVKAVKSPVDSGAGRLTVIDCISCELAKCERASVTHSPL